MNERSIKREMEAYVAEALREVDLGMFHFDPGVDTEQTLGEILRAIPQTNVAAA